MPIDLRFICTNHTHCGFLHIPAYKMYNVALNKSNSAGTRLFFSIPLSITIPPNKYYNITL